MKSKNVRSALAMSSIIPFIILIGCVYDKFDTKLMILNKSSDTIFFDLSKKDVFESHPVVIDSVSGDSLWNYIYRILPSDSLRDQPPFGTGSWEDYINEHCKDSALTVFIFDKRLLKSVSRDSLVLNQLYSRKKSFKVKDLERLKWRIEYP